VKILITSCTTACGEIVEPGEIVDLPDDDAKFLILLDKAEVYVAPALVEDKAAK